ncbi:MAG: hypothetical protein M3O86_01820 [Actinomycetota bacterium]|nr:hypothetical protein [Actinomycetota bacterium]
MDTLLRRLLAPALVACLGLFAVACDAGAGPIEGGVEGGEEEEEEEEEDE